jgi:hypothetical protein
VPQVPHGAGPNVWQPSRPRPRQFPFVPLASGRRLCVAPVTLKHEGRPARSLRPNRISWGRLSCSRLAPWCLRKREIIDIRIVAMANSLERGLKWWLRYVIVPLVGGGGIIAIWVATIERSKDATHPKPSVEKPEAGPEENEKIDFFLSTNTRPRDDRETVIGIGETVLIHWNILNSHGESFYLREIDVQGNTLLFRQVETSGILPYNTTETVDCILERDNASGKGRTVLGSLRILAPR